MVFVICKNPSDENFSLKFPGGGAVITWYPRDFDEGNIFSIKWPWNRVQRTPKPPCSQNLKVKISLPGGVAHRVIDKLWPPPLPRVWNFDFKILARGGFVGALSTILCSFIRKNVSFIKIPWVSCNYCPTPGEFLIDIFVKGVFAYDKHNYCISKDPRMTLPSFS